MSFKHIYSMPAAIAVSLLWVAGAPAQKLQPFAPVDFVQDVEFFAPADLGEFGQPPAPKIGFFGSYERVYWTLSMPDTVQIGSPTAEGFYQEGGQMVFERNSLNTDFITSSSGWGNRFELGYMQDNNHGWMTSIIDNVSREQNQVYEGALILFDDPNGLLGPQFLDINQDGVDDDLDGDNIFGRDGVDLGTPEEVTDEDDDTRTVFVFPFDGIPDAPSADDDDDRQALLPRYDLVQVRNFTNLNGVEVMKMFRSDRHRMGQFEFYIGARFLQIDDSFSVETATRIVDEDAGITRLPGPLADTSIRTNAENNIIGPQVATRWSKTQGRWTVLAEGRFFAGFNFQNVTLNSLIASNQDFPTSDINPLLGTNLVRNSTNESFFDQAWAPTGELRVETTFQLFQSVALKLGYTATVSGGVARASNRIDYVLPNPGLIDPGDEEFFSNGVNFGVVVNR